MHQDGTWGRHPWSEPFRGTGGRSRRAQVSSQPGKPSAGDKCGSANIPAMLTGSCPDTGLREPRRHDLVRPSTCTACSPSEPPLHTREGRACVSTDAPGAAGQSSRVVCASSKSMLRESARVSNCTQRTGCARNKAASQAHTPGLFPPTQSSHAWAACAVFRAGVLKACDRSWPLCSPTGLCPSVLIALEIRGLTHSFTNSH